MSDYTITYAQNREDIIINAFFDNKADGFYVDVGANHPTIDSVTKLFYSKGWRGINVEPNQELLRLLIADRPEDINVGVGVGSEITTATFRNYEGADGLSTFADAVKSQQDEYYTPFKQNFTDEILQITTLAKIFSEYDVKKIDFMKIDVEGYEYEVLLGNDWERHKPELICIEANHMDNDWRPILLNNGYKQFFNDGLNDYYAQKGSSHLKAFSFPEKVFMRFPTIVPYIPHKVTNELDEETYRDEECREVEQVSARTKVLWSLAGLKAALLEGLNASILRRKRAALKKRTLNALRSEGLSQILGIRKGYHSPSLMLLRIANVALSVGIKIVEKAKR